MLRHLFGINYRALKKKWVIWTRVHTLAMDRVGIGCSVDELHQYLDIDSLFDSFLLDLLTAFSIIDHGVLQDGVWGLEALFCSSSAASFVVQIDGSCKGENST